MSDISFSFGRKVIFYYESFRKVTEQDKKVDSYLILKRRPTTYVICMSSKKRANSLISIG